MWATASSHLESTHQGSSEAFVLEKTSLDKPSYVFSAVYPLRLVDPMQQTNSMQASDENTD